MAFWDFEVKSGQTCDVKVDEGKSLRILSANFGDLEDDIEESIYLHITVDGKKFLVGNSHPRRRCTQSLNLWFCKDFKISHTLRNGSVWLSAIRDAPDPDCSYLPGRSAITVSEDYDDDEEEGKTKSSPILTPTAEECIDIVTQFPSFEEGSSQYLRALHVFLNKPAREKFMLLKPNAKRMEFLQKLIH